MPSEPLVLAVCLTADRHEMTARAVRCFHAQTYGNKKMFVLDTGVKEFSLHQEHRLYGEYMPNQRKLSIGEFRNTANWYSNDKCLNADIIAHWDSDDYSHPNRIAEQVALLQASGKQCIGYRDMLFWREADAPHHIAEEPSSWDGCEAWLYHNDDPRMCLGTSLCYWRSVWEAKPFPDQPRPGRASGEDHEWLRDLDRMGVSSIVNPTRENQFGTPRMIASIHSGNSSEQYADIARSHNWKRVPEWDTFCRERMTL